MIIHKTPPKTLFKMSDFVILPSANTADADDVSEPNTTAPTEPSAVDAPTSTPAEFLRAHGLASADVDAVLAATGATSMADMMLVDAGRKASHQISPPTSSTTNPITPIRLTLPSRTDLAKEAAALAGLKLIPARKWTSAVASLHKTPAVAAAVAVSLNGKWKYAILSLAANSRAPHRSVGSVSSSEYVSFDFQIISLSKMHQN